MSRLQATLRCLFCLLLASWSVEAASLHQGVQVQIKHLRVSKSTDSGTEEASEDSDGEANNEKDESDDDDDDDDDDQDGEQAPVYETKPAVAALSGVAPEQTPKLGRPDSEEEEEEDPLEDNLAKQAKLEQRIAYYSNSSKSEQEIASSAKLVANQTGSPGTATMLAKMWKEMRLFDVPSYVKHAKGELKQLKKEEASLNKIGNLESEQGDEEKPHQAGVPETSVPPVQPPQSGETWDFWQMSTRKQESFLAGSCVYLVAGILLAYLHYKARESNQSVFLAKPRNDVLRSATDFSFSIFGCMGAMNVCVMGCCCPCMQWADTMELHALSTYWKAFLSFFILTVLYGYTWGLAPTLVVIMGVYYRQKLRETYNMERKTARTVVFDIFAWVCCQPCAIIQEAREQSIMQT